MVAAAGQVRPGHRPCGVRLRKRKGSGTRYAQRNGMGDEGTNWNDWKADGFRGPPPWRRGYQPMYFVICGALFVGLLILFWLAASGRLS